MNREQFVKSIEPLCDYYGKSLPDSQLEYWYEMLSRFSPMALKKAIRDCCKAERYFPTPGSFLGYCENADVLETIPHSVYGFCEMCGNTGLVSTESSSGRSYSFRCLCIQGNMFSERIPRRQLNVRELKVFKSSNPNAKKVSKDLLKGLVSILAQRLERKLNLFEASEKIYDLYEKFPNCGLDKLSKDFYDRWESSESKMGRPQGQRI